MTFSCHLGVQWHRYSWPAYTHSQTHLPLLLTLLPPLPLPRAGSKNKREIFKTTMSAACVSVGWEDGSQHTHLPVGKGYCISINLHTTEECVRDCFGELSDELLWGHQALDLLRKDLMPPALKFSCFSIPFFHFSTCIHCLLHSLVLFSLGLNGGWLINRSANVGCRLTAQGWAI